MIKVPTTWNEETLNFWRFTAATATGAEGASARAVSGTISRIAMLRADRPLAEVWSELPPYLRAYALAASATGRGDVYRRTLVRTLVEPWWNRARAECLNLDVSTARDMLAALAAVLEWTAGRGQRPIADWEREAEFCNESAEDLGDERGLDNPIARIWAASRSACALVGAVLSGKRAVAGLHASDLCYGLEPDLSTYSAADITHAFDEKIIALRELGKLGIPAGLAESYLDAALDPQAAFAWWQRKTSPVRVQKLRADGVADIILQETVARAETETEHRFACSILCDGGLRVMHAKDPSRAIDMMDEAILLDVRNQRVLGSVAPAGARLALAQSDERPMLQPTLVAPVREPIDVDNDG
ncbi:MAG: hypothetical protein ACHREM_01045 [Polyangiales bacterium]